METIADMAAEIARIAGAHADRHDREGSFVSEGVEAARELGYLAAPVPVEFGGLGAPIGDMADAQRIIGAACGSTALAVSMHLHLTLAAAWRWRRGDAVVEPLLRRIAGDRIVVVSTGGNDWTTPTAVATPVDGGWRIDGRKTFCSLSPAGTMAVTFAVVGEPAPGAEVIGFGLPLAAEGVRIDETWDAAGMRGTGSHDIVLDSVFVSEAQVTVRRTWGELDRPLLVAGVHAMPVIFASYLGVAEGLAAALAGSRRSGVHAARLVGEIDGLLRTSRWALRGAIADIGPDPDPTLENFLTVQQMSRHVTLAGERVGALAAQVAGGGAYARRGAVDRMIRDLRAAQFHPYPPDTTLLHAGLHRLGLPLEAV